MSHVVTIHERFNDRGWPYAMAELDCGHGASVPTKGQTIECMSCGATEQRATQDFGESCSCGGKSGKVVRSPNPHDPADRLLAVGDEVHCDFCSNYAKAIAQLRALDRSKLVHARYRSWCGRGAYYVYRREPDSPSGVTLEMSIEATDEAEELLRSMRLSPLSPTEGL